MNKAEKSKTSLKQLFFLVRSGVLPYFNLSNCLFCSNFKTHGTVARLISLGSHDPKKNKNITSAELDLCEDLPIQIMRGTSINH